MFDQPQSSNQPDGTALPDLNQDKDFPFKKVELGEKRLAGNKGPLEDILEGAENENSEMGQIREEEIEAAGPILKEMPEVPSMSEVRTGSGAGGFSPASNMPPPIMPGSGGAIKKSSKVFMIILTILVVAILGLAGVFAYQYFYKTKGGNVTNSNINADESLRQLLNTLNSNANNANTANENANAANNTGNTENTKTQETQEQEKEKPTYEVDSDNDGLTDEREIELGTNPNQADTDNDELNDFEEVEIYHTDPIKADTDGDSYLDGNEVKHGYDPLKPGSARLGE